MRTLTRRRLSRWTAIVAAGASAGLAVAGCTGGNVSVADVSATAAESPAPTSGVPADLATYYTQKLTWTTCDSTYQCTKLTVPLTYDKPGGTTIQLAVVRKPATDQAHRVGSLLVNPGGPGASGVDYVESGNVVTSAVAARYDIVGFDPRGVSRSAPVECLSDPQLDTYVATDPAPTTTAAVNAFVNETKLMGNGCEAHSAAELPYLGTENAARDMDVLRGALGDSLLYYLGKSYGTYLGAVYAGLFPKRVGRVVLDGALDPALSSEAMNLAQAAGFQRDADLFTADWVKRGDDPFGTSVSASEAKLNTFLQGLKTKPISGDATRKVDYALAVTGIAVAMYDQSYWSYLRQALTSALSGNGSVLLALADAYNDRGSNGKYTDNQDEANIAINCLDHPENVTVQQIQSMLPEYQKASSLFGPMLDWGNLSCDYWPVKSTTQPHAITAAGAAPILVVGTTNDPATPYAWAKSLASELSSGRLLTMNGEGHTAYDRGSSGSTCIDNDVDAYLLNAQLPAAGTVCQSNS